MLKKIEGDQFMKRLMLVAAIFSIVPFSSFAKETKGIEGLLRYQCSFIPAGWFAYDLGKLPDGKILLAESKEQATSLYLIYINADVESRPIRVPYIPSAGSAVVNYEYLRKVSCQVME